MLLSLLVQLINKLESPIQSYRINLLMLYFSTKINRFPNYAARYSLKFTMFPLWFLICLFTVTCQPSQLQPCAQILDNNCIGCYSNAHWYSGQCVVNIEHCVSYKDGTVCLQCQYGYKLQINNTCTLDPVIATSTYLQVLHTEFNARNVDNLVEAVNQKFANYMDLSLFQVFTKRSPQSSPTNPSQYFLLIFSINNGLLQTILLVQHSQPLNKITYINSSQHDKLPSQQFLNYDDIDISSPLSKYVQRNQLMSDSMKFIDAYKTVYNQDGSSIQYRMFVVKLSDGCGVLEIKTTISSALAILSPSITPPLPPSSSSTTTNTSLFELITLLQQSPTFAPYLNNTTIQQIAPIAQNTYNITYQHNDITIRNALTGNISNAVSYYVAKIDWNLRVLYVINIFMAKDVRNYNNKTGIDATNASKPVNKNSIVTEVRASTAPIQVLALNNTNDINNTLGISKSSSASISNQSSTKQTISKPQQSVSIYIPSFEVTTETSTPPQLPTLTQSPVTQPSKNTTPTPTIPTSSSATTSINPSITTIKFTLPSPSTSPVAPTPTSLASTPNTQSVSSNFNTVSNTKNNNTNTNNVNQNQNQVQNNTQINTNTQTNTSTNTSTIRGIPRFQNISLIDNSKITSNSNNSTIPNKTIAPVIPVKPIQSVTQPVKPVQQPTTPIPPSQKTPSVSTLPVPTLLAAPTSSPSTSPAASTNSSTSSSSSTPSSPSSSSTSVIRLLKIPQSKTPTFRPLSTDLQYSQYLNIIEFYSTYIFDSIRKFLLKYYNTRVVGADVLRANIAENSTVYIVDVVYRVFSYQKAYDYYTFLINKTSNQLELLNTYSVPQANRNLIQIDDNNRQNAISLLDPAGKSIVTNTLNAQPIFTPSAQLYQVNMMIYNLTKADKIQRQARQHQFKYYYPKSLKTDFEYVEFRYESLPLLPVPIIGASTTAITNNIAASNITPTAFDTRTLGNVLFPLQKFDIVYRNFTNNTQSLINAISPGAFSGIDVIISLTPPISTEDSYSITQVQQSTQRTGYYRVQVQVPLKYLASYLFNIQTGNPRLLSNTSIVPAPPPPPPPPVQQKNYTILLYVDNFPFLRIRSILVPIISLNNEPPSLNPAQLSQVDIKNIIFNYFSIPAQLIGPMNIGTRTVKENGRVQTYTVDFYDLTNVNTNNNKKNLRDYQSDGNYRRFIFQVHRNGNATNTLSDTTKAKSMVYIPQIQATFDKGQILNQQYKPQNARPAQISKNIPQTLPESKQTSISHKQPPSRLLYAKNKQFSLQNGCSQFRQQKQNPSHKICETCFRTHIIDKNTGTCYRKISNCQSQYKQLCLACKTGYYLLTVNLCQRQAAGF